MIQTVLHNWSLRRVLYMVMGLFLIAEAIQDCMWISLLPGAWFSAMGLFALGCARPSCGIHQTELIDNNTKQTTL